MHRAGGVLSTIKRSCFGAHVTIESKVWVPGRILEISIIDNDKTFTFIIIHFFGLQHNQVAQFSTHVKKLHEQTTLDPTKRFAAIVGDLNIRFAGDAMIDLPILRAQKLPKSAKVLVSALSLFTRVQHDGHSHYNASMSHLNTIDHVYISSPGWAQLPWRLSAEVGRPEILFDKGISDHSKIVACLHFDNAAASELPIPGWVAKSPLFKTHIQAFIDHSDLDALLPEHALATYKEYLREAGRLTRNELNDKFRSSENNFFLISF